MAPDRLDNTAITFQLIPAPKVSLEKLKQAFVTELAKILEQGLKPSDIGREKNAMIAQFIASFDSRGNRARYWGTAVLFDNDLEYVTSIPETVGAITVQDVNVILKKI